MMIYMHSQKFDPQGTQGASVKLLNRLRNQYAHFTPRVWALELKGLPTMAKDCLQVAEFLAWESHNVGFREQALFERAKNAFSSAHTALASLRMSRPNG